MGKQEHAETSTAEQCCEEIERVTRPFPDNESGWYYYLPLSKPAINNRVIDGYMPRVLLKAAYAPGQCSLDDPSSISLGILNRICCG